MANITISVNMDKKCRQCKKPGATDSGLCLSCITKNLIDGRYKDIIDKAEVQQGGSSKQTNQERRLD